jgi:hypothetical protein
MSVYSPVETSVAHRSGSGAPGPTPTLHRAAEVGVAAAIVAAAIAVDPGGLRSFTSLRWLLVSLAIAVATLAATGSIGAMRLPRWFAAAGLVVIGSMAVAALLVGDAATAWLGHPQRHLGVLAWVVFGAAAMTGAAFAGSPGSSRFLGRAAVAAAAITGLVSVADLLGWSPLGATFAGGRIGGLLGQPTTLGAFAVLLLPLAATTPVAPRTRLLIAAGLVVTVLGTQTRGAIIGLLAAGIVALPAFRPRLRPAHALWVLAGIVVLLATPAGGRLLSVDSGRMDEWRVAARVIGEHPVLGVGPEGYRLEVTGALDDDYVERHGREVVIDRAHSAPLDVAASGGALAGVAYVLLVGGVAVSTWRLQREAPWSVPAAAGTGAVGFLAAGFVAFPTPEVDTIAWLFGGFAVAAAYRPTGPGFGSAPAMRRPSRRRVAARIGAASLVGVTLLAGVTDVAADRWLAEADSLRADGRIDDAVASADRATRLRPDLIDGWYVAGQIAASGPSILDLDAGIEQVAAGLDCSPRDPALRDLHARLVAERARRSRLEQDRVAALDVLDALLRDDPTNPTARELRDELADQRPDRSTVTRTGRDGTGTAPCACLTRCETKR